VGSVVYVGSAVGLGSVADTAPGAGVAVRIRIPLGEEVHGTSLAVYVSSSPEGQQYESRAVPATCTGDLILDIFGRVVRFGRPIELDFWFQSTAAREITRPETIEWFHELYTEASAKQVVVLGSDLHMLLQWLAEDRVTMVGTQRVELPVLVSLVAADPVLEQKLVEYYPNFVQRHRDWIDSERIVALCTALGVLASTWHAIRADGDCARVATFAAGDAGQHAQALVAAREMRELLTRLQATAARVGPGAMPVWRQVMEATIACYTAEAVRLEQIAAGHEVHQALQPGA